MSLSIFLVGKKGTENSHSTYREEHELYLVTKTTLPMLSSDIAEAT